MYSIFGVTPARMHLWERREHTIGSPRARIAANIGFVHNSSALVYLTTHSFLFCYLVCRVVSMVVGG